jgi:3-hydroxyacyl-CoA dehydrogenase
MPSGPSNRRRGIPVLRAIIEIAFIVFLFYSNLLMGEFTVSNGHGKTLAIAFHDIFRRAAVLGAGTMGSRIAAHLANAGIPTLLLDLPGRRGPEPLAAALDALAKSKPAAFMSHRSPRSSPRQLRRRPAQTRQCDWVIEAVAENLAIKTALLARVLPHLRSARRAHHQHLRPARIAQIAAGLPRIATASSARTSSIRRATCACSKSFPPPNRSRRSSPPFPPLPTASSASRSSSPTTRPTSSPTASASPSCSTPPTLMLEQGLTIEEVDALTGPAIGWPRTGTFRLADWWASTSWPTSPPTFPQGVTAGRFSPFSPRS